MTSRFAVATVVDESEHSNDLELATVITKPEEEAESIPEATGFGLLPTFEENEERSANSVDRSIRYGETVEKRGAWLMLIGLAGAMVVIVEVVLPRPYNDDERFAPFDLNSALIPLQFLSGILVCLFVAGFFLSKAKEARNNRFLHIFFSMVGILTSCAMLVLLKDVAAKAEVFGLVKNLNPEGNSEALIVNSFTLALFAECCSNGNAEDLFCRNSLQQPCISDEREFSDHLRLVESKACNTQLAFIFESDINSATAFNAPDICNNLDAYVFSVASTIEKVLGAIAAFTLILAIPILLFGICAFHSSLKK